MAHGSDIETRLLFKCLSFHCQKFPDQCGQVLFEITSIFGSPAIINFKAPSFFTQVPVLFSPAEVPLTTPITLPRF